MSSIVIDYCVVEVRLRLTIRFSLLRRAVLVSDTRHVRHLSLVHCRYSLRLPGVWPHACATLGHHEQLLAESLTHALTERAWSVPKRSDRNRPAIAHPGRKTDWLVTRNRLQTDQGADKILTLEPRAASAVRLDARLKLVDSPADRLTAAEIDCGRDGFSLGGNLTLRAVASRGCVTAGNWLAAHRAGRTSGV